MCTSSGDMAMRGPSSPPAAAAAGPAPAGAGARGGRGRAGGRPPRRRAARRSRPPERKPSVAPSLLAQDLARIHYAAWVERVLHGAHERELDRGGVALELRHLGPT